MDDATWTSFDQYKSMLQAASRALGGRNALRAVGRRLYDVEDYELNPSVQAFGSPDALFADAATAITAVCPIARWTSSEVGEREWVVEQRLDAGFEPFPELCAVQAGVLEISTVIFGYPVAEVVEEQCASFGAPACVFRVRWDAADETVRRTRFLEERVRALEGRLEQFECTVADLVFGHDLQTVLSRTFVSATRAVRAPICVLSLTGAPEGVETLYASGVSTSEAGRIANWLPSPPSPDSEGALIVEVASTRSRYGWLAAIRPAGGFMAQEMPRLQAYASLVAAALDSATALIEARHQEAEARRQEVDARRQGDTARALLELSMSLAEVSTVQDMAAKLVRAVPAVMGCDFAAVLLPEQGGAKAIIVATHGYTPGVDRFLRSRSLPILERRSGQTEVELYADTAPGSLSEEMMALAGASARMIIPIVVDGEWAGAIDASVSGDPGRLCGGHDATDRLRGLAAQAATAIRNARLLERVRHEAMHDPLTGLPNRALILDRAAQMLARARRQRGTPAALFIDLDGFKEINDTFGHAAGDELLLAVAARIREVARPGDTVGRLGGDEFVVLVDGPSQDSGVELIAQRILAVLCEPFRIAERQAGVLSVTASIGVAVGNRPSPGELLRDADVALYQAKAAGKNRYLMFEAHMQATVHDRLLLHMDLQEALRADRFTLLWQPICRLSTGEVTGVEAALRWVHPSRGELQSSELITLLEECGLILDVGRWLLQQACRQGADWHRRGLPVDVAVKVSGRQLQSDRLVHDIQHALDAAALDAASLVVEITESDLMTYVKSGADSLRAIRGLGVRVAIDDFGTGYSTLSVLREFPVDILKIDRAFGTGMDASRESTALVRAVMQLANSLGVGTSVEGVGSGIQYVASEPQYCDRGHGVLITGPLPAAEIEGFLAARQGC
ncbi:EAL domain-containing protein [Acidiferrimicrobium sp. IK]|uniref:EAL domain-containing protein n=1 Tax=Acidiferrimicrobium sp. IK TaxID=2871700 RepID=UPI0021CB021A|nr:EAL domain-containing protein [Acidiferrimicrobium sp. IK]MCU4187031.1 EAL domain-containing protein [Acidiferrimicrobium sp. IK]